MEVSERRLISDTTPHERKASNFSHLPGNEDMIMAQVANIRVNSFEQSESGRLEYKHGDSVAASIKDE